MAFRVGSTYATRLGFHYGAKIEGTNFIKTPLYKTYTKVETDAFTMDTFPPPDVDKGQSEKIIERSREVLTGGKEPETPKEPMEKDWIWWDKERTIKVKLLEPFLME